MLAVVVCILTGVICIESSLRQNLALGIPHPLTINREILQAQLLPRGVRFAVQDATKKDVSYTLPYEDYLYLKRHKAEGQDSPYDPDPIETGPAIIDIRGKQKLDHVTYDAPRSDAIFKRSIGTNTINGYNNILENTPIEPEVYKHVYFHVPPPDFVDSLAAPRIIEPTRKKLNILFIKVPSYDPSQAFLQQQLQNQQAPIADKTLIYVLSKNENLRQHVVLPPKPSAPEVYFVNYKTTNDIEPINDELSLSTILQNSSPVLEQKRVARDS